MEVISLLLVFIRHGAANGKSNAGLLMGTSVVLMVGFVLVRLTVHFH